MATRAAAGRQPHSNKASPCRRVMSQSADLPRRYRRAGGAGGAPATYAPHVSNDAAANDGRGQWRPETGRRTFEPQPGSIDPAARTRRN